MKRCFIFGALDVTKTPILPEKHDLVIAADKGFVNLKRLNIIPDTVVGDFDSLGEIPNFQNTVRLEVRKDDTDTAHCIEMALKKGYDDFVIYGAVGGRLDHSFANIQIASDISKRRKTSVFIGEKESFTVIKNGKVCFYSNATGRISVFSLCDKSYGVTEKGLSYTLKNAILSRTEPLGISNEFIGGKSEISVTDGELLVVWEADCLPSIKYDI